MSGEERRHYERLKNDFEASITAMDRITADSKKGHCSFWMTPQPEPPAVDPVTGLRPNIVVWEAALRRLMAEKEYHRTFHSATEECVRFTRWLGNEAFMKRQIEE